MSALIASSKISGCRDTGFAFGMALPQMAIAVARLSHRILVEEAFLVIVSTER